MKDSFYSSFEAEHRGNRDDIRNRLKTYIPFLMPFKQISDNRVLLDLGCGRGEWLELAKEEGFNVKGADLDEGMLSYCNDLGLDVVLEDAINFLKNLPDNYADVISSFHVVEHIGFSSVKTLFYEAYRVLKPGGIVIIETPNSENIVVGSNSFYLDPTHERPIPHQLLSFLAKHVGFKRNKILRLQEKIIFDENKSVELIDVLAGVSPDYSLVAQKQGPESSMVLFDSVFSKNYGISLNEIANKFNADLNHRFYNINVEIAEANKRIYDISQHNLTSQHSEERNILELRSELIRNESQSAELRAKLDNLEHELKVINAHINNTYFNKIKNRTKSALKKVRDYKIINKAKFFVKSILKRSLSGAKNYIFSKPKLKNALVVILHKVNAYDVLKKIYFRINAHYNNTKPVIDDIHGNTSNKEIKMNDMSERTRRIYQITKSKMDKK